MTPKEFYERMFDLLLKAKEQSPSYDLEDTHVDADNLMCQLLTELGYGEGVALFKKMPKWYA